MTIGRRRSDLEEIGGHADSLRALIADDDDNFRRYIASVATRLGFAVEEASDGEAAMTALSHGTFDLLILDQAMPHLTGLEMIYRVRATDATRNVYAVMLTGYDDTATKIAALTAGYDDFVTKASTELEIAAKIVAARRLVSRQRILDRTLHELYGLATRDELTGLFNRRFFMAEIERHVARRSALTLVLFDLDDFKRINDTHGHLAGDQILRDVGKLFLRRTRSEDLVARFGGDEFVMIASEPSEEVASITSRVIEDIESLAWTFGDERVSVGVTVGIAATIERPAASVLQLLDLADRDLYRNKSVRKNLPLIEHAPGPGTDIVLPLTTTQEVAKPSATAVAATSRTLPPARPSRP